MFHKRPAAGNRLVACAWHLARPQSPPPPFPTRPVNSHSFVHRRCTLLKSSGRPGATMPPVEGGEGSEEEGEEGEVLEEGLVTSASTSKSRETSRRGQGGEREWLAAEGAEGGRGNERQPSDRGLEKLERAKAVLLEGGGEANIDIRDVRFSSQFCATQQGSYGLRCGVETPWSYNVRGAPVEHAMRVLCC